MIDSTELWRAVGLIPIPKLPTSPEATTKVVALAYAVTSSTPQQCLVEPQLVPRSCPAQLEFCLQSTREFAPEDCGPLRLDIFGARLFRPIESR